MMDITDFHVQWSVVIVKWELTATTQQASVKQVVKNIGVNQNVKVTFFFNFTLMIMKPYVLKQTTKVENQQLHKMQTQNMID